MSCCGIRTIIMQGVVIAALGVGAGLIDSSLPSRRLIKFEREAPPELNPEITHTDPKSLPPPIATPDPKTPAASTLKPGDPGWLPTEKAALPKGQITLDEAKKLYDTAASFVDARRKEDYEQGHIKGAMRINLKSFENGDPPLLAMIPRDAIVVVYCSGGNCDESEHVADFMANSGYKKVYVIHDGYPGWKAMGWPVETGEGIQ